MQDFRTVTRRMWDAKEEEGVSGEVLEGVASRVVLDPIDQDMAHHYVLTNQIQWQIGSSNTSPSS
jgi:hypothetical protein